ncbi:glutamate receptor ionotropic, kainate 1 isoform X6 [Drosophila mauritiana]|uniref:Glutamate receptor ionotropic, kainate 1 isoform X6 n=1 Tax=Drosophila mauritiana TaxID=7226 RepID=A0A6P8JGK5_DROMA|nr:glutamate receptor ionotropic, kainate 1 isoform X6 [Drosophila mauritiana]
MFFLFLTHFLLIALPVLADIDRSQFMVGSIFTSDKDESEIAFRTAVDRANILERNVELVPIVVYANTDDSFIMEKMVCNLISQGVIAIFGPSTGSSSDIIASICDTLDIPHIVYDWIPNESIPDREHSTMTLNVHPDNLLLSQGLAEIVQSFAWRSFTVVYETDKELQQLQDILQVGEPSSNPTTVKQLGPDDDHRPFLKEIKLSTDNCLILHCAPDNLLKILQQANELKMLGEYQEPEEVENIWSIMNTTWLSIGSLMGQGCDILPKAASTRLVTGMWWFFALMMLNSYTANLAAFLTNSRQANSINSAEDLAAQSKIKYGAMAGGSTMGFFRDSNFSTYQKMWTAMESASPSVFTKTNDEGVERVQKGKNLYAFLMESTTLEYNVERKCDLVQIGGWLDYKSYGIAMPFNSPYRKQISAAVLKLGELGQLAELKRKWWKEMHGGGNCEKSDEDGGDTPELGLENVGGVFLVLGLGLFAAMVLGCTEFLWNVKSVAIEEKISLKEAFKSEALFAARIWITTKPVHTSSGSGSSTSSSSSSSRSKHSFKSQGLSMKSLKSSGYQDVEASVHSKLKKIGSMFSLKSQKTVTPPPEIGWKLDKSTQIDALPTSDGDLELIPEVETRLPHRHHHHHHHRHHHHHHQPDQEHDGNPSPPE